ncbi:uncharacterized protein LOC132285002 isoform X1 [Cornus florida]|uniref:uncharacterized protein LOC132285002 isoform X1 n=1 Tax=Cornus florida TaxID=4283 RepID=UPI00289DA2BB|nr:uncharacterized protein LOC132285002 isoform X1 [Cornus florida]
MQFNEHEDDFIPRVPIERARSSCSYPLTHLLYDGLSRKSLSYGKLPQEPLRLTILKLDGSSFEVEVAKTATVAELKQAVEGVFSHFQKKGSVEISWSHVWGNFCLCYFCHKLLSDDEFISFYGIKDGDQLQFVRHDPISCNPIKRESNDQEYDLEQARMLDFSEEREQNGEKDDGYDDQENLKYLQYYDTDEDVESNCQSNCANLLGGWFSYRRLPSPRRFEDSYFPSRSTDGFLGSSKNFAKPCSNKPNYRRDAWKEI